MNQAAILLDFQQDGIQAELQFPAGRFNNDVLQSCRAVTPAGLNYQSKLTAPMARVNFDGAPYDVMRLHFTAPAQANQFDLRCDAVFTQLPTQAVLVSIRTDWRAGIFATEPQLRGVLRGAEPVLRIERTSGNWLRGFQGIFALGVRHIAEGTDHLLFLLVLLLPAPLLAIRGRWCSYREVSHCFWQTGKIVTAFTAGHSLTLAAGTLHWLHLPSRPVEVLIAVSILVSAVHAFKPVFPGREMWIAGGFGLVHGMAFASTLAELGLQRTERLAGILSFNLGVEAMQLTVVACVLPALLLFSRTPFYAVVRVCGALFGGIAAAAWILERLFQLHNPVEPWINLAARQSGWLAPAVTAIALLAWLTTELGRYSVCAVQPKFPSKNLIPQIMEKTIELQ